MEDCVAKGRTRSNPRKGSQHGRAKLNEEQVLEIRKMISQGYRKVTLAKMFGVSKDTIVLINRREIWTHI